MVTCLSNPTGETYDIVTYGGTLVNPPTVTTGDIGRLTSTVNNGTGSNDKVTLSVSGSVANLIWTGAENDNWDNNTSQNFTNDAIDDVFRNFDNVLFDASTTFNSPLLVGTLSAGTLTFTGATDYTLGGTGSLAVASFVKSGSHTLTIANTTANTYTGNVTITDGTLKAGSATALGAAVVGGGTYISGGGTLDVNAQNLGGELVTIAGTGVGGNGTIVNSGASQIQALRFVTLSGDASIGGGGRWDIRGNTTATLNPAGHKLTKVGANYIAIVATNVTSGDIDVNEGTLAFSTTTTVNGTGTLKVNSGGTMEIGYGITGANFTRDIVLNGGTLSSAGSASAANSDISLTSASAVTGNLTLNGNLTQSGGAHTLTKLGNNTLIVTGTASTRTGETIIDNGIIQVDSNNALGSGKITIGQTTLCATSHSLRLNGVAIDNDVDSKYMYTVDYKGAITAIGGATSTINGDVTFLPLLSGASNRGGDLAGDATAGSVLRLMGELNVGGGRTSITHRDGVVEYGGGASTSYTLGVTNTARLAANNGIGSGVTVNLGASGNATLDLNGFSASVESVTRKANTTRVENNGSSDSTLTVSPNADRTYSGGIRDNSGFSSNKVSLVKEGSFSYTLSGTNSYTGTTQVNQGALIVNGNNSAATGAVTVAAAATLGGTGTVGGALTVSGNIAPGNSIGTLNAGSDVTWNSGTSWKFELSSTDNTSDRLAITGQFIKGTGGAGDFVFDFMGSTPVWGETYTLATFGSLAGGFTAGDVTPFAYTNLGPGSYSTSYFTLNGTNLQFTAIPEPTSMLAGLLRRRRNA